MREGYDHIGDISWDAAEHGRILLPLECYYPPAGNTCQTGSIGVADPRTLKWRYYVKLDPRYIAKAMWAEVSPDGKLVWTSSGSDLLAYRDADVKAPTPGSKPLVRHPGHAAELRPGDALTARVGLCARSAGTEPHSRSEGADEGVELAHRALPREARGALRAGGAQGVVGDRRLDPLGDARGVARVR
ncbi:MAG: hypothetical protein ACXVFK_13020, partial [Solirubrobacteraceae bacterium]